MRQLPQFHVEQTKLVVDSGFKTQKPFATLKALSSRRDQRYIISRH